MTSRNVKVSDKRQPTGWLAAMIAFTLLSAIAACSAAPSAGQPGSEAKARTSPVSVTRPASRAASTPAGSPSAGSTRAGSAPTGSAPTASAPASGQSSPWPAATPAKPSALQVAPPGAGSLPQTSARPRTDDAAFASAVHDIWLAVTTGDPRYARPAFFPEKAYLQVKAIADPAADWQGRLWSDFTLDLAAARRLVKPGAVLTKVIVPAQYAQWIPAGACYNSVGYWHVPGSRVVYREGGVTHSFGIASLISWRGDWYLVHLGAMSRDGAYGIVDDPETGQGIAGPPGGC